MGFGLLFIAYMTAFIISLNPYALLFKIVGYGIMCKATAILSPYNKYFKNAKIISMLLTVLSVLDFTHTLFVASLSEELVSILVSGFSILSFALIFALHYNLLFAIKTIATEVEVLKLVQGSVRNWVLTLVYTALALIQILPLPEKILNTYNAYFSVPLVIFMLAYQILNAVLIFSCYRLICLEGDEDMPFKENDGSNKLKIDLKSKHITDDEYRLIRERLAQKSDSKKQK